MSTLAVILANTDQLTREVFGNVPSSAKAIFYLLTLVALANLACGSYRRVRLWRLGRPSRRPGGWTDTIRRLFHAMRFETKD